SDTKNYTVSGGIKVDIFGGRFEDGVYLTGRANVSGGAVLNIFGGEFACPIYAAHDTDTKVGGDIEINVSGGSFCGDIGRRGVGRSFTLNMADGDFARVCAVDLGGGVLNLGEEIDLDAKISGIGQYQNPVAGYADPSVVYHDGWYYYSYAKDYLGEPGLWMAKAPNVFDIGNVEPTLIWSRATSGTGDEITSIWAPQLYNFDGKWYLYATCDVGIESTLSNGRRMPTVWLAKTDNPIGEYEYFGVIKNVDMDVVSYNSPRFIEHGGRRYMVNGSFFREEDCTNQHIQRTFITELSDPLTASSKAVVISSPVYDYEKNIMEGPFPIYSPSGTLYMIFAAGHTRTDEYCTGILRFNGSESDSLADASKWEKFSTPLQFASYENGVYSPGAMVVTKTPSGDGYIAAYHAKQYHYSAYTMRRLYVQKLWFENDFPVIDEPQAVDTVFELELNSLPLAERIFGYSGIGVAKSDAAEPPKGSVVYVDYFLFGDVNFDEKTDLLDVLKLLKILVGERCEDYVLLRADTDGDGEVTARDVLNLLSTIL
ncbi:MAG: family 43 glycosylhydrolase, partial [Clostridia bacterium]|nr:family 43 glycosylhydrolase [Clostridia bacterium]